MINAEIHSVATDSEQQNFFAVLTANQNGEDRWMPIRLGAAEAVSIATEINDESQQRPGSHDLITRLVDELGGRVDGVRLEQTNDDVASTIEIVQGDEADEDSDPVVLDARPSDALAVAVRLGTEISVDEQLLRETSRRFEGNLKNAHPSSEVTQLQYEMQEAVEAEDYERASELKNEIQSAMRRHEESMDLEEDLEDSLESSFEPEE
jgi:bifunctional DNase/RNase